MRTRSRLECTTSKLTKQSSRGITIYAHVAFLPHNSILTSLNLIATSNAHINFHTSRKTLVAVVLTWALRILACLAFALHHPHATSNIRSVYKAFTMVILCGCLTPRSLKQLSSSTISKSMTPWCSTLSRYGCASLISGSFTMV